MCFVPVKTGGLDTPFEEVDGYLRAGTRRPWEFDAAFLGGDEEFGAPACILVGHGVKSPI